MKFLIEELFDKKLDLLTDRSPITYVKNVKGVVCIIAAQNDSRTPIKPVLRYATELAKQSGAFELHSIPDQGHNVGSTQGLVDSLFPAIAFLQRQFPSNIHPQPLSSYRDDREGEMEP